MPPTLCRRDPLLALSLDKLHVKGEKVGVICKHGACQCAV
jgi:hypothetical protein